MRQKSSEPIEKRDQKVLDRIAAGESMKSACEVEKVDRRNFLRRIRRDDTLAEQYQIAREMQADAHADDIIEAANLVREGKMPFQDARVYIDTLKWTASKLKPKSYGERMEHNINGEVNLVSILQKFDQEMIDVTPDKPMLDDGA